jgi:hypothetical protein
VSLARAYIDEAERSLRSADVTLNAAIQEKAAFLGYHAFESCGGAFCASRGVPYPRRHPAKLNTFKNAARLEREARRIAQLAIELGSLRNLCLYPEARQDGTVRRTSEAITPVQAARLLGRIRSLSSRIAEII